MSNPTSNFGWQMPTATDLVTDLPADFEVFGQAVDTDFVDLLGGTTGQILSKTSATDLDFTWIANDQGDITGVTAGNGITVTSPTGPVPTVAIDTAITVDKTTAQTLTNKTLTTPIISSISNTGTLTLPTSTDTLVGRATTDTLTNKTLTSPALTTPTISTATTNGDILYGTGSGALARLGIGSASQVLTVASGIPSWATLGAGALTLIKRASFSNVATTSTTFDTVFTSTYKSFMVVIEQISAATEGDDLHLLFRYGGTSQILTYFSSSIQLPASGTIVNTVVSNGAQATLAADTGGAAYPSGATMYFSNIGNGSSKPFVYGQMAAAAGSPSIYNFSGYNDVARSYDGFLLKSSSTNISGTVSIYGLATS